MEPKINRATDGPEYENFEPKTEVISADDKETLVIYLPGFKKSDLRLQLTPNRLFKLSGERRPVGNNKWSRIVKEYPASANGDLSRVIARFENEALSIIQPKLIAKVADKEKPAGAESTSPALPKSSEKPANVEAQAQPKQKGEGSNNNRKAKPLEDDPLKQKEESKMAEAQTKSSEEYSPPSSSAAAGPPAANAKTSVLAKKETDEKMKGTVAEDDEAVAARARKTSDDQKHGNGSSLARIGGWTKTLVTMIASKPRMAVNIVLVVVLALLLGLYIKSSPAPAKNNIKHD